MQLLAAAVFAVFGAVQPIAPPELRTVMSAARVEGTPAGWCRGQFRAVNVTGYAVAVTSAARGGRYLILEGDTAAVELASFSGAPDLACYTPAEARRLNDTIRTSVTITGKVAPTFATTVVCAFVEDTRAVCWQYSTATHAFVQVGEWQT